MPSAEQFYIDYDQFKAKVASEQKNIVEWFQVLADDVTGEVALIQEQLADVGRRLRAVEERLSPAEAAPKTESTTRNTSVIVSVEYPGGPTEIFSLPLRVGMDTGGYLNSAAYFAELRKGGTATFPE